MDDFYIVLSSNACPLTQPSNTPSNFITEWENNITLEGDWRVALSEVKCNFPMYTLPAEATLKLSRQSHMIAWEVSGTIFTNGEFVFHGLPNDDFVSIEITKVDGRYKIDQTKCDKECLPMHLTVDFHNSRDAHFMGFGQNHIDQNKNYVLAPYVPFLPKKDYNLTITLNFTKYDEKSTEIVLTHSNFYFRTTELLRDYLQNKLKKYFEVGLSENGHLSFKWIGSTVYFAHLQFKFPLQFVLGFQQNYRIVYGSIEADFPPQLNRAYDQMMIYADIVKPIMVGGVLVPLLRNVYVKQNNYFGQVVNHVIDNPMYLKTSCTSFNRIEVNIRSDSGTLIPFADAGITCLTLHFIKHK